MRDISAVLAGHYRAGRASGKFDANLLAGRAAGGFQVALAEPPDSRALQGSVKISSIQLAEVWRLLRSSRALPDSAQRIRQISGDLDFSAQASGSLAEPQLAMQLALRDGEVAVQDGQPIRALTLFVDGDEHQLLLRKLSGAAGKGRFESHGNVTRIGESWRARYSLELSSHQFPVPAAKPLWVDLQAHFTGTLSSALVTGVCDLQHVRVMEHPPRARGVTAPVGIESASP